MIRPLTSLWDRLLDSAFSIRRTVVFEARCRPIGPPVTSTVFRYGNADDLSSFSGCANGYGAKDMRFCEQRLAAGDSLFIGSLNGDDRFGGWMMRGQMDLDWGRIVPLRSDIAYSYKLLTLPEARGLGICRDYYRFLTELLEPQGINRIVCRIAPGNTASIRAHLRVGFRRTGVLWKVVLGPFSLYVADAPLRMWLPTVTAEEGLAGLLVLVCWRSSAAGT